MPYKNVPESKWGAMDRCVEKVMEQNPGLEKENAIAICHKSIMGMIILEALSEPAQFIIGQEEDGEVLRFRNAILVVAETNQNRDTITEEGISQICQTLPGRPIDWDHEFRQVVGMFTEATPLKMGETWGASTGGLIWADRFPEAADGIQAGRLKLSIEARADKAECSICGGVFDRFLDYCQHLLSKATSGATRILHGLKSVGGALTASPAGTGTEFDLSSVYFVAHHREEEMETIDILDEDQYHEIIAKKLSYQEREDLEDSDFALIQERDGKKIRRFPLDTCARARNAKARLPVAKDISSEEKARVARKADAKINSPECKRERKSSAKGGMMDKTIEEVQAALDEMTKNYDEQFAAREQAEADLEATNEKISGLEAKVEELTASVNELTAENAEVVTGSRIQALVLGGAMTEDEAEEAKETIAKMDEDSFNLLLAKAQSPEKRAGGSGGFTPGGDGDDTPRLVL